MPQTIDGYLAKHREILDRNDPAKKFAIYFDEWGSWYDPEPGTDPGFLVQRNTLRDAVLAALHFHVFHRHAERVKMANSRRWSTCCRPWCSPTRSAWC